MVAGRNYFLQRRILSHFLAQCLALYLIISHSSRITRLINVCYSESVDVLKFELNPEFEFEIEIVHTEDNERGFGMGEDTYVQ